jgi:MFS family permease
MNVVYALVATPAGTLSDRIDRRWILAMGLGFLIAADVVLAFWASVPGGILGVALWGLHMGLTQGLLAALVVDTSPPRFRGTAFGLFNLASGVTLLAASTLGGLLWSSFGASATFLSGAGFSVIALLGLLMAGRRPR